MVNKLAQLCNCRDNGNHSSKVNGKRVQLYCILKHYLVRFLPVDRPNCSDLIKEDTLSLILL